MMKTDYNANPNCDITLDSQTASPVDDKVEYQNGHDLEIHQRGSNF